MRSCAVTAALLVLLAGCASTPGLVDPLPPPQAWQLSGRLALSNGRDGGSGSLEWTHGPVSDELRFHGALGRGSWRLSVKPGQARLETADGQVHVAPDVATLVELHTGWRIPVEALTHWVVGEPSPDASFDSARDSSGRLELLRQHDWLVRYEGFHEVAGRWLPRKLIAEQDGDEVRLLVRGWQIDQEAGAGR